MSPRERLARRVAVRVLTIAVIAAGLLVVYGVRRRAIRDFDVDDDFDAAAAPPAGNNATQPDILRNARNALEPYLTHAPSRKRHALFLLVVVVLINSLLRLLVRRGAMLGAHSTRTTEQSAALVAYWAAATATIAEPMSGLDPPSHLTSPGNQGGNARGNQGGPPHGPSTLTIRVRTL